MSIAQCELHDSVNHSKSERILLLRVILEIMFSECHCLCFGVVCIGVCFFVVRLIVSVQMDEQTNNVNNTQDAQSQGE